MKRIIKPILHLLLLFPMTALFAGQDFQHSEYSIVHDTFQTLYIELDSKLDSLNSYINTNWNSNKYPVVFSTELLAASPNRGDMVLEPRVLEAVKLNLNAFKTLGVTGVSMAYIEVGFALFLFYAIFKGK